jgi:hypothetical protein
MDVAAMASSTNTNAPHFVRTCQTWRKSTTSSTAQMLSRNTSVVSGQRVLVLSVPSTSVDIDPKAPEYPKHIKVRPNSARDDTIVITRLFSKGPSTPPRRIRR